jgi:hypothetical protein
VDRLFQSDAIKLGRPRPSVQVTFVPLCSTYSGQGRRKIRNLPAERLQRIFCYSGDQKIKTVQCGLPERNFFLERTMNIAKPQSFRLDKITAARRQLDTAIELLFENKAAQLVPEVFMGWRFSANRSACLAIKSRMPNAGLPAIAAMSGVMRS